MNIKQAIEQCLSNKDLSHKEMTDVMQSIMTGETTPLQIAGFLIALRAKGETVTEITTAVSVMRHLATSVNINSSHLVDIVGTGGDGAKTFNISTAASFVVAAAGGKVAKHGNRSVSSASGAADLLETAKVNLNLNHEQIAYCIETLGIGFMFAPNHHNAMKHVIIPRKELGVRTLFNLLGPLTNPANAKHHLIGVYDQKWLRPFAEVLQQLGSTHAMVIHAKDGLDEISIAANTKVAELKNNNIIEYEISPSQFDIEINSLDSLRVNNAYESLQIINDVFNNKNIPAKDIVILNAGAAIYTADLCQDLAKGIQKAEDTIASGAARAKFQNFIALTQSF